MERTNNLVFSHTDPHVNGKWLLKSLLVNQKITVVDVKHTHTHIRYTYMLTTCILYTHIYIYVIVALMSIPIWPSKPNWQWNKYYKRQRSH